MGDMGVIDRVKDLIAFSPGLNETDGSEFRQMV
jgi:hypothetical protein